VLTYLQSILMIWPTVYSHPILWLQ